MARNSETVRLIIKLKDGATGSLKGVNTAFKRFRRTVFSLKGALAGVGAGLVVDKLFDAGVQVENLNRAFKAITGSSAAAADELAFLRDTSETLGREFYATADAYKGFLAAADGTAIQGQQTRDIFTSVLEASTALGMSIEDTGGTLRAFTQMVSKGNVQAEELRGQLGERLYGAFNLAAQAMGKSTMELNKMLENGEVLAADLLPRLARLLHEKYGQAAVEAADKAVGASNSFKTAWNDLRVEMSQSGFMEAATDTLRALTDEFKDENTKQGVRDLGSAFAQIARNINENLIPALDQVIVKLGAIARGAGLRSIQSTFKEALDLSEKGLIDMQAFIKAGYAERQKMVDEAKQSLAETRKELEAMGADLAGLNFDIPGREKSTPGDGKDDGKDDGEPKTLSDDARLKSEISRIQAITETGLAELEQIYEQGMVSVEDYFSQRTTAIENQYDAEIKALEKLATAETDPDKKRAIEDEIFSLQEERKRELIDLTREETRAYEDLYAVQQRIAEEQLREKTAADVAAQKKAADQADAGNIIGDLAGRVSRAFRGDTLDGVFGEELREMDARHAEEIQRLKDLNATKEQIDEAYRLQKIEKDRLLVDQEKRLHQSRLQNAQQIAQGLSDIFDNLYELTGKKHKEFFYLAKAAAIAEATMNIAQGITKAIAQGGWWGYLQAGILSAAGAVQLATITAQTLALGGRVRGSSPSDTADNVPIWATAGEFMQPVSAVKYYGMEVMEAMRKRMIPREFFKGIKMPRPVMNTSFAMAAGGSVPAAPMVSKEEQVFNLFNVLDPSVMDHYMASAAGQNSVVNVISLRKNLIKRILKT